MCEARHAADTQGRRAPASNGAGTIAGAGRTGGGAVPASRGGSPPGAGLRRDAAAVAARFSALRASAQHLADAVLLGAHGRRRPGMGEDFWQFRPAVPGDNQRDIDWRRSGRDDVLFVREREWEASQSVLIWVDMGQAMDFSSDERHPPKAWHARLLALALALLLDRAGERVGLLDDPEPPGRGPARIDRLTARLSGPSLAEDHPSPPARDFARGSHLVLLSDFLGNPSPIADLVTRAGARGVRGVMCQILDPAERSFPYDGRTVFESMSGASRFETMRARSLRPAYLDRLSARQAHLQELGQRFVWPVSTHATSAPALQAMTWLYRAVEGVR